MPKAFFQTARLHDIFPNFICLAPFATLHLATAASWGQFESADLI